MALVIKDRIKETTTTTGTGDISLGGTSATFDTFASCMSNSDTTYYAIVHTATGIDEWEVGLGTYNSSTNALARTTVLAGSNGTSAVNFSAGDKSIFITFPSEASAGRTILGLGTAATTAATDYAAASHTHVIADVTDFTDNSTNWNTAYGWGDHASAGYLTSYTETDPVYTASSWYTTTNNSTNWDTAYGWGDHASAGYLTSITGQSITSLSDVFTSMSPADGQVLTYDTTNGWQAETPAAGGVSEETVLALAIAL